MKDIRFILLTGMTITLLGMSSCCPSNNKENATIATGMSPAINNKMMQDSQLYRSLMTEENNYKLETQQFLERVKKKITSIELQTWAISVLNAHKDGKESFNLSHEEIPDFILKLDPPLEPLVIVNPKSDITIMWGGGFGHWGLFVTTSYGKIPEKPAIYMIKWTSNVHAFHDIQ